MSELRDLVIDAHGGIERWNKVKIIIEGGHVHHRRDVGAKRMA
jgi:hypothetical protein